VHDAEILILLTSLSFGGYGSQLKKAIDRLIPLVSPFFELRQDLTHHQHRYDRMPRFVGIGWGAAVLRNDRNTWDAPIIEALRATAASCFSGGCGACRIQVTDHAENVALDEPNDVSAEDRSRGNVPACLVRLRGPVTFMVP